MVTALYCLVCHEEDGVERRLDTTCDRCGGPACSICDLCNGCRRIVCEACNQPGVPAFAFPGDRAMHPHNFTDL